MADLAVVVPLALGGLIEALFDIFGGLLVPIVFVGFIIVVNVLKAIGGGNTEERQRKLREARERIRRQMQENQQRPAPPVLRREPPPTPSPAPPPIPERRPDPRADDNRRLQELQRESQRRRKAAEKAERDRRVRVKRARDAKRAAEQARRQREAAESLVIVDDDRPRRKSTSLFTGGNLRQAIIAQEVLAKPLSLRD